MAELQKNTSIGTLLKFLDAKARITIWKDENNRIFDGNVYHLYDMKEFHNAYVTYMRLDEMAGINVKITEEWQN